MFPAISNSVTRAPLFEREPLVENGEKHSDARDAGPRTLVARRGPQEVDGRVAGRHRVDAEAGLGLRGLEDREARPPGPPDGREAPARARVVGRVAAAWVGRRGGVTITSPL